MADGDSQAARAPPAGGPDEQPEAKRRRKSGRAEPTAAAGSADDDASVADAGPAKEFRLQCVCESRSERFNGSTGCDIMAYRGMAGDELRMGSYRRAVSQAVLGKRVLELGPGPLCPLTLMCVEGGATEIVAVERSGWVATAARELLAPHTHVTVLEADAATLRPADLPTGGGHFDVLVQELFGTVAGAEDVVEIIAALRANGFTFDRVIS